MATNEAKIVFTGDTRNAVSAVGRLKTELAALDAISSKALGFGLVGAATAAVVAIVASTKAVADQGDALNKMSQKTGLAVEELSKLQYAADLSGVSSEALQKGLVNLSGGMVEAATGAGPLAEKYQQLGITLRNTDGTMKSSGAVLGELADRFKAMPDGVEKTALATDLFGKRLGAEMIPLLNGGAAGLKAMGDEAEALGLVMSSQLAKESEAFNDNLDRLGKLGNAVGISLGNALIPALNRVLTAFVEAKKAGGSFWESLNTIGGADNISKRLATINGQIAHYNKLKAQGNTPLFGSYDEEIKDLERMQKILQAVQEKQTGDGVQSAKELAAQRVSIETQMQAKLAEIAKLRGVAEGKVSADILLTDDKRIAAQIKNAEKLRDALSSAWKQSVKDAEEAGKAAAKLFDQAANTRQTGADKADAKRRSALSPEEQQAEIQSEFESAASSAETNAGLATIAAMHGRLENAAKLSAQAQKDAERAANFADQIDDPAAGANAIEKAAEIQAKLQEAQGKAELEKQSQAEARAADQAAQIASLDAQLTALQTKASALKVEADISAAQNQLVTLQAQLDNLKDKTVTVTVQQVNTGGAPLGGTSEGTPVDGFARGGFTGPGGKYQPAGIVHKGEYVLRQEVVRQRGALALLERLNRYGISAIPGYANGGLVGNLRVPSLSPRATSGPSSSGTPINLYLDGHRIPVTAEPDVASTLTTLFAREALKRGRPS